MGKSNSASHEAAQTQARTVRKITGFSKKIFDVLLGGFAVLLLVRYLQSFRPDKKVQCSSFDLDTLSCSARSQDIDSCCVEKPGGLLLLAQLWNPVLKPENTWTIHGLWPNMCNGSYAVHCDPTRNLVDIPSLLNRYGEFALLRSMKQRWKNDPPITTVNGSDADLWAHEWSKHGTCLSTLEPICFKNQSDGLDAIKYFKHTLALSEKLPTFEILAECGIKPSRARSFDIGRLEACLANKHSGTRPIVRCDPSGQLNEVWYFFHSKGSLRSGETEWMATNATAQSNCPASVYYPSWSADHQSLRRPRFETDRETRTTDLLL